MQGNEWEKIITVLKSTQKQITEIQKSIHDMYKNLAMGLTF